MKTFGLAKAGLAKEVYYNVVIVKYHSLLVQDHWEFFRKEDPSGRLCCLD